MVYEQGKFGSGKGTTDPQQKTRDLILEKLERAVLLKVGGALDVKDIRSRVVTKSPNFERDISDVPVSRRRIYVNPLRDQQTCTGLGSCSFRLTVAVRMLAADSNKEVWSTEVEEPYMVSSFVYDQRYEELAGYISKAILAVVTPASTAK